MDLPGFPHVDLFAAGINAVNGTLVASSPTHNRSYTFVGLVIMGFLGGIGGGVTRDAILGDLPGPLAHASFLIVCLSTGLLGIAIHRYGRRRGERFHRRTLAIMKSFSLPWFAILGTHKALEHDLGIFAAIIVGVIATTAGGVLIDLISGVTPKIVTRAEHLIIAAVVASAAYAAIAVGLHGRFGFFYGTWTAAMLAFVFRMLAVHFHWEEIVPTARGDAADSRQHASPTA